VVAEYAITGTVPARASQAVIGLRVNAECSCSGAADLALYEAHYADGSDVTTIAPDRWRTGGEAAISAGPPLQVQATPPQTATVDSEPLAVTAGARFKVSFTARIAPHTRGSGYFSVVFVASTGEVARRIIPLQAPVVPLGHALTRADGSFEARLGGTGRVEAWYRGDSTRFPAFASATLPSLERRSRRSG
jgi:hypothetical protein